MNEVILDGYPFLTAKYSNGRDARNSDILKYLLVHYPECYWCGRTTFYWEYEDGGESPPNAITKDHLVSRFIRKPGEVSPKVTACYSCNFERCKEEQKVYGRKPV